MVNLPPTIAPALAPRRLGGTALHVSRLGLGLAALGRPAYHTVSHGSDFPEGRSPRQLELRAHAVLDAAYEAGIRYVDVARSYGHAEAFLRSWADARRVSPAELVVGSKWGYRYTGAWRMDAERHEVKDHSLAAFRAQLAETDATLGPLLSLYQLHSATADGPALADEALLDDLACLRDRGVSVGLTVSGPRQAEVVRRALEVERGGRPLFATVQATWNLLETSCDAALSDAHAAGLGVIVKEALANGRLSPRGDGGAGGLLHRIAGGLGYSPDAVALAAALSRPWADVVLLGAASVEQLRANLRACELSLGDAALGALAELREDAAAYWRRRADLPWR